MNTMKNNKTKLTQTLIIGYGSDIRGDDALGPRAAELIEMRIKNPNVHVMSRASLTPELAANVAKASLVVFIDCAAAGPIGQVVRRDIKPVEDSTVSMVHFLDPPALLYWSRLLYGHAPKAIMLSVPGASFEVGDTLSPPARQALPKLVDEAVAIVSEHCA